MRKITRYQNRKLYDSKTSRYITQKDLLTLFKTGENFTVFDQKSATDITDKALTKAFSHVHNLKREELLNLLQDRNLTIPTKG